ncbi:Conserved_hypothetical protein [Hexamita inflata]|uniref:Uncharacterized protein n=1 Tax=Hexamita inflata TaxID=28002 RepID=A0AA86P0S3_9EUKA|nr:Conserved hypothetical protein [Hexamita inflata]
MNDAFDLARLQCNDNELVLQLSKLLENIILCTATKGYLPLSSVTSYLLQISPEERQTYYREIGHNQPYDLNYVRVMLLGKKYKYFQQFLQDLDQCFVHYAKVQAKYLLPDIIPQAKTEFYQTIQNMNFTGFLSQSFTDELVRQVIDIDASSLGQPIKILGADEARYFMFLCENFSEDQIDQTESLMYSTLDQYDYTVNKNPDGDQVNLHLNMIYPEKARKFIQLVQSTIASKDQTDKTIMRMEYWNSLVNQYKDMQKE